MGAELGHHLGSVEPVRAGNAPGYGRRQAAAVVANEDAVKAPIGGNLEPCGGNSPGGILDLYRPGAARDVHVAGSARGRARIQSLELGVIFFLGQNAVSERVVQRIDLLLQTRLLQTRCGLLSLLAVARRNRGREKNRGARECRALISHDVPPFLASLLTRSPDPRTRF